MGAFNSYFSNILYNYFSGIIVVVGTMSEAEGPVQGCSSTASVEMSSPAAVHSLQKFRSVKMDSLGSGNGNNNNYSNNNNNASNNEPRSPTSDRLASSYKNLKKFSNAAAELLEFRTRHRRRSNRLEVFLTI